MQKKDDKRGVSGNRSTEGKVRSWREGTAPIAAEKSKNLGKRKARERENREKRIKNRE